RAIAPWDCRSAAARSKLRAKHSWAVAANKQGCGIGPTPEPRRCCAYEPRNTTAPLTASGPPNYARRRENCHKISAAPDSLSPPLEGDWGVEFAGKRPCR